MPPDSPPLIALVGPTCTGKTDLSIVLAEKLNGGVVLCDSRTIYCKMDIGTAKPTVQQQSRVPHFMIDLIEPERFYSVAEYKEGAEIILQELGSKSQVPIVCGGTGLYARALLEGIDIPAVPPQVELRKSLNEFADLNGNDALHSKLELLDPKTAKRLSANDRIRVIRALEVSLVAGKPFSELAGRSKSAHRTLWIGLGWSDRAKHKAALTERFDQQVQQGLLDEVENLFGHREYEKVLLRALNYKEFFPYLNGAIDLQEVRQNCITSNFQLSRKQMIWFRANSKINWFAVDEMSAEDICERVLKLYRAAF
jgi:tRNA dimethylallyltransferase